MYTVFMHNKHPKYYIYLFLEFVLLLMTRLFSSSHVIDTLMNLLCEQPPFFPCEISEKENSKQHVRLSLVWPSNVKGLLLFLKLIYQ